MFNFFKKKKSADDPKESADAPDVDLHLENLDTAEPEVDISPESSEDDSMLMGAELEQSEQEADPQVSEPLEPETIDPAMEDDEGLERDSTALETADDRESKESADVEPEADQAALSDTKPDDPAERKPGFFARIRAGLTRTRTGLTGGLADLLLGKKEIDDDLLEELETSLIMADVGVEATNQIMSRLTERVSRKELSDSDALYSALVDELTESLRVVQQPLIPERQDGPFVILMVGINGVGKTTTIGKLARQYMSQGKSVMLAAGDTFRAAAVEQLEVWGERNQVPVIAQHTGADSASVIFDAVAAAKSRGVDVLIADTAGRLHNKDNLMQELEKVVRVMKKLDGTAPHEVMLVLDAGTGQNAINQTKQFMQTVGVTGLTLTKLDGTAKGGVIFALASQFAVPVRYIGVGEGIEDLQPFKADDFIKALFDRDSGVS